MLYCVFNPTVNSSFVVLAKGPGNTKLVSPKGEGEEREMAEPPKIELFIKVGPILTSRQPYINTNSHVLITATSNIVA